MDVNPLSSGTTTFDYWHYLDFHAPSLVTIAKDLSIHTGEKMTNGLGCGVVVQSLSIAALFKIQCQPHRIRY